MASHQHYKEMTLNKTTLFENLLIICKYLIFLQIPYFTPYFFLYQFQQVALPSWISSLAISLKTIFLGHSIRSIIYGVPVTCKALWKMLIHTHGFYLFLHPNNSQIFLYLEWPGYSPTLYMIPLPQWAWCIPNTNPPHISIPATSRYIPYSY